MQFLTCCKQWAALLLLAAGLNAQVYSPKLLRDGQPDPTDLARFAQAIYKQAHAVTPRQKAEAIWRFFLTDGRFVEPGFFYHIAGWSYEEPAGEVLDPIKLLNSYGFGLCYHIAPLLQAVFLAGGFADARVWFLTGHTVAEVYYAGRYHYFDSDMMGYNVAHSLGFRGNPVTSVHDIERDGSILTGKLLPSGSVRPGSVDDPWYPADVRAHAIPELAALFTTTQDNSLYPFTRYALGHTMDFALRKGESITRFFSPEEPGLFYLPYVFDGVSWKEFPQANPQFHIRTADGPRSQKDNRTWATGRIDYDPAIDAGAALIMIDVPSPYVIIDAQFQIDARLDARSRLLLETSTDRGTHWIEAASLVGPHEGLWRVEPKILAQTHNGRLTAVSGTYGYQIRISKQGSAHISHLHLTTRFEVNPRSLPAVQTGENLFRFTTTSAVERIEIPAAALRPAKAFLRVATEHAQTIVYPEFARVGYAIYMLEDAALVGFDVGVRFLDLPNGRAPDKLTAEVRTSSVHTHPGPAGLAWSTALNGPYRDLWKYSGQFQWLDGEPISRLLRWPEVFKHVDGLPAGVKKVYLKIYTGGPAFDSLRVALYRAGAPVSGEVRILQKWHEDSAAHEHLQTFDSSVTSQNISIRAGQNVRNDSITLTCR